MRLVYLRKYLYYIFLGLLTLQIFLPRSSSPTVLSGTYGIQLFSILLLSRLIKFLAWMGGVQFQNSKINLLVFEFETILVSEKSQHYTSLGGLVLLHSVSDL